MTITEFLLARITEDEQVAQAAIATDAPDPWENPTTTGNHWPENIAFWDQATPYRILRECTAKRAIIKQHEDWPVLIERPPIFDSGTSGPHYISYKVTQQIAWTTEREYVKRFGEEPPTAPMIRTLAAIYSDHPDYQDEWRVG